MAPKPIQGKVLAVSLKAEPGLPKHPSEQITLLAGCGVEGDYHAGTTIRHRYLARKDPERPNNRQVLLVDLEIINHIKGLGIQLAPGELGENILVEGVDLMALEIGTCLEIGPALVELTEVREPCYQLDGVHPGLERAVEGGTDHNESPNAGMLGIVVRGGLVQPGQTVSVLD